MKRYCSITLKLLLCYLMGGAAYIFYIKLGNLTGNAHVPFSGFPAFLVMAPLAPYIIISDFLNDPIQATIGIFVYLSSFITFWMLFTWCKPKK